MPIFGPEKLIIYNKLYLHENQFVCLFFKIWPKYFNIFWTK